jgi:hypothetical protein
VRRKRRGVRPSVQPCASSSLIDDVFARLKLDETARSFRAVRAFARAAGPRISSHARAERLRGAVLYVRVSSSAWAHEMHALKEQLVDKLRRTAGGEDVRDLRFSVGPLDELPGWDEARRDDRRAPTAGETASQMAQEMAAEVAGALAGVGDAELRQELSRLYARLGARRP